MPDRAEIAPDPIDVECLRRLHPNAIAEPARIRALLARLRREGAVLRRGTDRYAVPETARICELQGDALLLETRAFECRSAEPVLLNAVLDGRPYFFSAPRLSEPRRGWLRLGLPAVVYEAERRDRLRGPATAPGQAPPRVALATPGGPGFQAELADVSPDGLGVRVRGDAGLAPGARVQLRRLDGPERGVRVDAEVRNVRPSGLRPGWQRLGLARLPGPRRAPPAVERCDDISPQRALPRTARAGAGALARAGRARPRVVQYANERGEGIRALLDTCGDPRGAPAVVIPPAWGKTKETLLPLAAALQATFERAGSGLSVLRFDGIRRRGESHNDPGCALPGRENLHYTFSQGARDIAATLDFLEREPGLRPSTVILVTFSVASIEGRRAVASERRGRIGGWISAVGASDPQSLIRVISGGVDYLAGAERGVDFGLRDVQGLLLDVDRAGRDALEQRIAFLDDACRDMCAIDVPVTWIHGRHDAWTDLDRVRRMLSFGDASRRRLLDVPLGHQLRTSAEAEQAFRLIAAEAARMALGREVEAASPDPAELRARRRAERLRLPRESVDVRGFWRDYLLGRERRIGMELVTSTAPYRGLMDAQVRALDARDGQLILDLGAGVGPFPLALARSERRPGRVDIVEVDYVAEALARGRTRLSSGGLPCGFHLDYVVADLDIPASLRAVPVGGGSADAVLASLLLNYVSDPGALLREIRRVLRPGGRLVLSSLRRDADTSRICVDGVAELRSGRAREVFGADGERGLDRALGEFIGDAGRLLDLEERGLFRFWDEAELVELVEAAGFSQVATEPAFGDPPQAIVLRARAAEARGAGRAGRSGNCAA